MDTFSSSPSNNGNDIVKRNHRSHLNPACFACRKRKSRCTTQRDSPRCVNCMTHNTNCEYPQTISNQLRSDPAQPRRSNLSSPGQHANKSQKLTSTTQSVLDTSQIPSAFETIWRYQPVNDNQAVLVQNDTESTDRFLPTSDLLPAVTDASNENRHESHIVSPALAEDDEHIQRYFADPASSRFKRVISTDTVHGNSKQVLFTTIQRHPLGVFQGQSLITNKRKVIENLIEPYRIDLLDA